MKPQDDTHFRHFASSLEREIGKYGEQGDRYQRQKQQMETLIALETEFRKALIAHAWGPGVYRDFIQFICDEKRNILAARPFFRERQPVFTQQISKALKNRSYRSLRRFHFNYQFVVFALKARKWRGGEIVRLANEISRVRTEIVETNLPLAISRARIFFSRTPKSHLQYMDLIQIGCEGLMAAIDKYVPPPGGFTAVFRGVAIGRMTGNFIEEYSETPIHFYPADKRKIYRANKIVGKFSDGVDYQRLANEINTGVDAAHRTSPAEIADLMAAASCVSADSSNSQDPESPEPIERFAAPESTRPDVQVEQQDSMNLLEAAMSQLTVWERKILKLKGISV